MAQKIEVFFQNSEKIEMPFPAFLAKTPVFHQEMKKRPFFGCNLVCFLCKKTGVQEEPHRRVGRSPKKGSGTSKTEPPKNDLFLGPENVGLGDPGTPQKQPQNRGCFWGGFWGGFEVILRCPKRGSRNPRKDIKNGDANRTNFLGCSFARWYPGRGEYIQVTLIYYSLGLCRLCRSFAQAAGEQIKVEKRSKTHRKKGVFDLFLTLICPRPQPVANPSRS
jgi:hypothetical protein